MNVFEDLIDELKEENLIEETVIESNRQELEAAEKRAVTELSGEKLNGVFAAADSDAIADPEACTGEASLPEIEDGALQEASAPQAVVSESRETENTEPESINPPAGETLAILPPLMNVTNGSLGDNTAEDNEFFRRRAMEEVSSLQTVEHIISGVEREQMKTLPKTFNDITVSKALHDFLKISKTGTEQENAQAEFTLMQETESWYSALAYRDKNISVGELRRYCETTKPALSQQALTALARFYRNSPYSESVRAKFDMVATRLLSKEVYGDKRELAFERDELIKYLSDLYANWSSIPLYATDDDSEILITTLKFEDFMSEAEAVGSFEELVKNDFFNRLRLFKESAGENFYAPLVTATAIESNVRVGNRWVDLIRSAREKADSAMLEEKYGFLLDQTVSDVTSKSMQLAALLKIKTGGVPALEEKKEKLTFEPSSAALDGKNNQPSSQTRVSRLSGMNKWLLAGLVLTVLISASMMIWVDFLTPQTKVSPNVKRVNLDNTSLKDDLKAARINAEVFYGVVQPSWDAMTEEKKEELLKKLYSVGDEKGYKQVQLLNAEGKTVGYASEKTINISN